MNASPRTGYSVEELSSSLVREYLSRKGLKGALAKFDEELPMSPESAINPWSLVKALKIDKQVKKNKEQVSPYQTLLEIIVNDTINTQPETHGKPITSEEQGSLSQLIPLSNVSNSAPRQPVKASSEFQSGRGLLSKRDDGRINKKDLDEGSSVVNEGGFPSPKGQTSIIGKQGYERLSTRSSAKSDRPPSEQQSVSPSSSVTSFNLHVLGPSKIGIPSIEPAGSGVQGIVSVGSSGQAILPMSKKGALPSAMPPVIPASNRPHHTSSAPQMGPRQAFGILPTSSQGSVPHSLKTGGLPGGPNLQSASSHVAKPPSSAPRNITAWNVESTGENVPLRRAPQKIKPITHPAVPAPKDASYPQNGPYSDQDTCTTAWSADSTRAPLWRAPKKIDPITHPAPPVPKDASYPQDDPNSDQDTFTAAWNAESTRENVPLRRAPQKIKPITRPAPPVPKDDSDPPYSDQDPYQEEDPYPEDDQSQEEHSPLLCEDVEDFQLGPDISLAKPQHAPKLPRKDLPQGEPISADQAKALRKILFGDENGRFNAEWKQQGLAFNDTANLEFGLVQRKGGPCGTLASLQAHVIKHLLYGDSNPKEWGESLNPSESERNDALVSAIAEILWRAGDQKFATVALCSSGASRGVGYKRNDITDHLNLVTFNEMQLMILFLEENLAQVTSDLSCGCITFTISVILSRGITLVQSDMDEPSSHLIGAHGYCTQELVNLILTGRAASNVFDGVMNLDSGDSQKNLLKGIHERSDIGFLSLFEHYGSCQVGSHYKTPHFPIFVVCSESHFLVLYSTTKMLLESEELQECFDLFYYDGLANQKKSIRLTIKTGDSGSKAVDSDLAPPIELCIRTRWKECIVDWNGSEKLL